ncbi:MAG TPA: ParB/RepB/Spo0J family partition protein [Nocardioides sp.]|nr:ParB/RepB/Spo0J family partition protein [Nocardioides sp.]
MTSVLERLPERVQAGLIDRVLATPHPKLALPTIASNAHMTLADLQVVLNRHGYPDRNRLAAARDQLIAHAEAAEAIAPDAPVVDVDQPADEALAERLAQVPVGQLQPDPENPREKILDTDVEELADSIAEIGLLQPIVARQTARGLVVVAGHRRLAAVKLLGWTHAPVIVRGDMRPDHVLAAMLIENGQRRDLDPIEEARGLRKLKAELGCQDLELAKKVGRSQSHVSGRLALLLLSVEDQDRVRAGELGITQATGLGRLNGGKVRKHKAHRDRENHFGATHELANHARARCKRLGHKTKLAGGVACGECWESVLRADERDDAQQRLATTGHCPTCG